MPQLACSALRACAAVFPKGVLARAPPRVVKEWERWPGHALRAPGEDGVISVLVRRPAR